MNAGTATASYTYAGDANHTGSSDSKTFTIGKATSTTTVTLRRRPVTYTGSAQTPCYGDGHRRGGLNLTPTRRPTPNNTNAGTATASYTYAGDCEPHGQQRLETFAIGKAASTTTVTLPGERDLHRRRPRRRAR